MAQGPLAPRASLPWALWAPKSPTGKSSGPKIKRFLYNLCPYVLGCPASLLLLACLLACLLAELAGLLLCLLGGVLRKNSPRFSKNVRGKQHLFGQGLIKSVQAVPRQCLTLFSGRFQLIGGIFCAPELPQIKHFASLSVYQVSHSYAPVR